jgi:hypothetical protein
MLITDAKQLTPQVLTTVLRHKGYLEPQATVKDVRILSSDETNTSYIHRAAIRYTEARSLRKAPVAIFLKVTKPGLPFAQREVTFYTKVAPRMYNRFDKKSLPLALCYDAYYDDDSARAHLLLDDISDKYFPAKQGLPPTERHTMMVLEKLANFHAYWWENPALDEMDDLPTEESIAANEQGYRDAYDPFLTEMQYSLSARHREILDKLLATGYPTLRRDNLLAGRRLSIVHRDAHPENVLYAFDSIKMIDWQSWRIDAPTDDIAYFIACHFSSHTRRFKEKPMLQRYYDTLTRNRVQGYSWDDLWDDYRASVARCILFLLRAWSPEKGKDWWRKHGELALNAFDELDGMRVLP